MNDSNIYKFQNKFNCKTRKTLCLMLLTLPQSVFLQTHTLSMQASFPSALSLPARWDRRWMFSAEHDWDWAPSALFICGPAGRAPPLSSLSQGRGLWGMHRALQKDVGLKISKDVPKLMISVCYLLLRDKKWKVWCLCPASGIILQKNTLKGNWDFYLFVMFWYLIHSWKNCFSEL